MALLCIMGPMIYAIENSKGSSIEQSYGGSGNPPETQWFTGEDDLYCEKLCYDPDTGEQFVVKFYSYICQGFSLFSCVDIRCDVSCWDILF